MADPRSEPSPKTPGEQPEPTEAPPNPVPGAPQPGETAEGGESKGNPSYWNDPPPEDSGAPLTPGVASPADPAGRPTGTPSESGTPGQTRRPG